MANKMNGEAKQVGETVSPDAAFKESLRGSGSELKNRKHQADVGTPSGDARVQAARKDHHGYFAEAGAKNDGDMNNDWPMRQSQTTHTKHPEVAPGAFRQRPPLKKVSNM